MGETTIGNEQIKGEIQSIQASWGVDGIYSTTSSTFAQLGFNLLVGNIGHYDDTATIMKAILIGECDAVSGTTGEMDLYNYTDSEQVADSVVAIPDIGVGVRGMVVSPEVVITPGKDYRVRIRRVTGSGSNAIYIRAASLLLKFY